jgi:hypothetical protein
LGVLAVVAGVFASVVRPTHSGAHRGALHCESRRAIEAHNHARRLRYVRVQQPGAVRDGLFL